MWIWIRTMGDLMDPDIWCKNSRIRHLPKNDNKFIKKKNYPWFSDLILKKLIWRKQTFIITSWAKCFVFLESWTFCFPVLGSRHCTGTCQWPNNWPCLPAWHRSSNVQSAFPYMAYAICTASHRRRVAKPPFSHLGMINLWWDPYH